MTDNPDNEGFNLDEESFDNFEKKKGTLGEMWREKPMFKVVAVVGAAVLIFGFIFMLGGGDDSPAPVSVTPSASEITSAPGTQEASPAYIEAVKEQNEQRLEEAERTAGSALPTPIDPPVGTIAVPEEAAGQEDPLQRWRKLQEERLERELQRTQALAPQTLPEEDANRQQAIQNLAATMAVQMQAVLESRNNVKISTKTINDKAYLQKLKEEEERAQEQAEAEAAANNPSNVIVEEIIFPAGEIAYAQLITEANSDAPGPVLAQIAGGPLNGARILGSFAVQKDLLTLRFTTIVLDGISYGINGIALDPATTLPAMATDVDHHYLQKIVLPMAAAFVEGMADAISESGRTTVIVEGDTVAQEEEETTNDQEVASGITEAGAELSEILSETADEVETTVIIASGTQIGVLFLDPVTKSTGQEGRRYNRDFNLNNSSSSLNTVTPSSGSTAQQTQAAGTVNTNGR